MKQRAWAQLGALTLLAMAMVTSAWGQQPAPSTDTAQKDKPPERLIYLPYKSLKAVFDKPDGTVLVPYADYIKLWEKAFGDNVRPAASAPGVITSAAYTVKADKDTAQMSAALVVQVFEKGWTEVPIHFGDAAIGKMTSDSGKIILRGTGKGTYSLLIPTAGEHKVQFELTTRVKATPEGKTLDLEIPPVAITTFEMTVPEGDQSIELVPQLVAQPIAVDGKESKIKATLGATEKVSVRWHPRIGTKPELASLASVTNQTRVTIEDGLIHTDAWLTYDVLRGQLDRVKLVVPKDQRILDITSESKVREWKATEEGDRQVVTVELLGRVGGKATIEVHTERTVPAEAFEVAGLNGNTTFGIHALDVVRESGTIALQSGSDSTLSVEEPRGLIRIDDSEVDAKLKKPGAIYYKYYTPAFQLKVLSKPVEARLIVDHRSQVVFRDDQISLKSTLNYSIDRAGVFELKFKLPEKLTVENVICDRLKQFDVSADQSTLTISLREKTMGDLLVVVTSRRPFTSTTEKATFSLPILEPQAVEVEKGAVQVYAPDAIEVITDNDKLISAQPDPKASVEPLPNVRLVSSWSFNRRPVDIPVRTLRMPTRLTAVVGTKVDVKQGQLLVTTALNYIAEFAGIDTYRFAVPEAISSKIQITSKGGPSAPTIKQKSAGPASDGWVTWTVVMQRDVIGSQLFEVTYDQPIEKDSAAIDAIRVLDPYEKTANATTPEITIARVVGEMTVTKDRALSISASVSGGDAEPIDVRELQTLPQDGIVAFRYFKQPTKLELTSHKYDIQNVVDTIVSKSLVEMVLDRTGVATNRCRYVLKTSERQRLRIDLPANVDILSVLVDRKPTALEKAGIPGDKAWDPYYVNVARTKSSDEPFTISVIFRHPLNPSPFQNAGGSLAPKLPLIGGAGATNVAVQQLYVKFWIPSEFALVGTPKSFSVQTRTRFRERLFGMNSPAFGESNLEGWIGADSGGVFDFPTEGHSYQYMNLGGSKQIEVRYWKMPFYTAVISGALILIALVLRKTSTENKLTALIVALFAASAYALRDYDFVLHWFTASFFGLIGLAVIWVIHGLMGQKSVAPSTEKLVPAPVPPTLPPSSDPSSTP